MRIGILGGGQLSRMLALAGMPLGLSFAFYTNKHSACVAGLGKQVTGSYQDSQALENFASQADIITYENENIPLDTLDCLSAYKTIYPNSQSLKVMQDRLLEKRFFNQLAIPATPFFAINDKADLLAVVDRLAFPLLVKKRQSGYDGKGQCFISGPDALAYVEDDHCRHAIVEQGVPYDREVSIIAARSSQGELVFYDLCENLHKHGILARTTNQLTDSVSGLAKEYLTQIMQKLDYVGICTLELFQVGDKLIANELAPRVHNSGHWTIEGAVTSQFENHLRSILGWPLGNASSAGEFVMYNILSSMPDKKALLQLDQLHLHDYLKESAPGRKLGHLTLPKHRGLALVDQIEDLLT
jgi:5-(carboxyamino)imidazole ribonucleotide synthase